MVSLACRQLLGLIALVILSLSPTNAFVSPNVWCLARAGIQGSFAVHSVGRASRGTFAG